MIEAMTVRITLIVTTLITILDVAAEIKDRIHKRRIIKIDLKAVAVFLKMTKNNNKGKRINLRFKVMQLIYNHKLIRVLNKCRKNKI